MFNGYSFAYTTIFCRESPSNTAQHNRNAEHAHERESRIMHSPEHRRLPQTPQNMLQPIPFPLSIPQRHTANTGTSHNLPDDPFQVIHYKGQQLHLTQGIANQVRNLPPLVPTREYRRDESNTVCLFCFNQ